LLPSNVTIGAASAASVATINTVTSVAAAQNRSQSTFGESALCLLPLGVLFFRRTRSALALALISATTLFATGCGSGGTIVTNNSDPNLRYTPPGIYQYQVTATSTTGVPVSQTVTLNLTVTSR
jgi:spore maturation protein SpmA